MSNLSELRERLAEIHDLGRVAGLLGWDERTMMPLVAAVVERADAVDDSCLRGSFPEGAQRTLIHELVAELPFPPGSWRLDPTAHPFATSISPRDLRLTTRYDESYLSAGLFAALHEAGHGLYGAGIDPALARSPLGRPRSLGLHESQSRLWENWVGRGRPYLERLLPRLRDAFPSQFDATTPDELHRAANRVSRSLIRIEADELTYNLHILIRFELELELFEGRVAVAELPEAWGILSREHLGIEVPDDAHGVLQDVHWAACSFGYFPTYSLGNVIAAQLWNAVARDVHDLEGLIGAGELEPLGVWLRDRVHSLGRMLEAPEIVERATGEPIDAAPLLRHLAAKFGAIYELDWFAAAAGD